VATHCPNGHEIAEGSAFCPVCGVRLEAADEQVSEQVGLAPESVAPPLTDRRSSTRRLLAPVWDSRGWKGKTAVVVLGLLIGLGVLGAALGDGEGAEQSVASTSEEVKPSSQTKKQPKAPRGYRDLFITGMTTEKAAKPLCATYRTTSSNWLTLAQGRLASSRGADADAYAAAEFQGKVSWLHRDHSEAFNAAIYRTSRVRLRAVTRRGLNSGMVERFSRDALSSCRLRSDHSRAYSAVGDLDTRRRAVLALAASLPWYPRGFYEWSDNLAWQWVDNPSCDYFTCWQMRVVTRDGCPSGLYAEINIKRGGTVVDYSNDALGSLGPGETALLEFTDASDSGGTGSLTEIDCY
jgi:hypothetical protein